MHMTRVISAPALGSEFGWRPLLGDSFLHRLYTILRHDGNRFVVAVSAHLISTKKYISWYAQGSGFFSAVLGPP